MKELRELLSEVSAAVVLFAVLGGLVTFGFETTRWVATGLPFDWGIAASGAVAGVFGGALLGILGMAAKWMIRRATWRMRRTDR